eukprot:gene8525-349_t
MSQKSKEASPDLSNGDLNDTSSEDEGTYEVEAILYEQMQKGKVLYLVKWNHYPISECTWEPESHAKQAPDCFQEFKSDPPFLSKKLVSKISTYPTKIPKFTFVEINGERTSRNRVEYRCKWNDIDKETWEPRSSLDSKAIREYERNKESIKRKRDEEMDEKLNKSDDSSFSKTKKLKIDRDEDIDNLSPINKKYSDEESEDQKATIPNLQKKPITISEKEDLKPPYKIKTIKRVGEDICGVLSQNSSNVEYYKIEDLKEVCPNEVIDFLLSKIQFSGK